MASVSEQDPLDFTDTVDNTKMAYDTEALIRENNELRWENAALREEVTKLQAKTRQLRVSNIQRRISSSTIPSSAFTEKSYMKPTMASRFRQAAVCHTSQIRGRTANQIPSRHLPSVDSRPQHRRHTKGMNQNSLRREVTDDTIPGYMRPTAASSRRSSPSPSPPLSRALPKTRNQSKSRQLRRLQHLSNNRISPSSTLVDALWERLQLERPA